ncbi:MAG: peptidoglycan-binding protein [Acetobacteraceae bacterium]
MYRLLKFAAPGALGLLLAMPAVAQSNQNDNWSGSNTSSNQNWQNPNQNWQSSNQGWQRSNQGWQNPNQNWQASNQGWQNPNRTSQSSNQGWQNPSQNWQSSNQGWQNPNQNWHSSNQGWQNPNQNWQGQSGSQGNRYSSNYDNNRNTNYQAYGSTDQAVSQDMLATLQRRLQQRGFYRQGSVDGLWGPETENALGNFQQQNNLRATGKLDAQTLAALDLLNADNARQGQNYSSNYNNPSTYGSNDNRSGNYADNNR